MGYQVKNVILSIIVPVYNVEKFLKKGVDSLLNTELLEKIEILLIDDGSTDSSGKICDELGKNHENIKVYHKQNGGLSDARNYGLIRATGEYVLFFDSDDMFVEKGIDLVLRKLMSTHVDIILWDAIEIDENDGNINDDGYSVYCHDGVKTECIISGLDSIICQLNDHNDYITTVWSGAYNRKYLMDNQLWFEKGLLHEDELWTQKVLITPCSIYYIGEKLYKYRIRSNSIMNNSKKDKSINLKSLIYAYECVYAYCDWKIEELQIRRLIKGNISKRYLHSIYQLQAYRYRVLSKTINKNEIFRNAYGMRDKIRALILKLNIKVYCISISLVKNGKGM